MKIKRNEDIEERAKTKKVDERGRFNNNERITIVNKNTLNARLYYDFNVDKNLSYLYIYTYI